MIRKTILLAAGAVSILALSTLSGISLAYLTSHAKLDNMVQIGLNHSVLEENFPTPEPIRPDTIQTYKKAVSVHNTKKVPCFVRVLVAFSNASIGDKISYVNLNTTDWVYIEDHANASLEGYYYYKYPLAPGASTSSLFTGLKIGNSLDFSDNGADNGFQVILYEETVQCEPYTNYQDAWNAFIRE